MENKFIVRLTLKPDQLIRLQALQANFVEICNAISPVVQAARCWNRVVLHHMVYHKMREQFPNTGSQMVCNAIYSVCRAARTILQHPQSPWNINLNPDVRLPNILFLPQSPVFFDRHTLNLKGKQLSMYTLDGRIRFDLSLSAQEQAMFHEEKLKEVLLLSDANGFSLHFYFGAEVDDEGADRSVILPNNIMVTHHAIQQPITQPMQHTTQPMAMAS